MINWNQMTKLKINNFFIYKKNKNKNQKTKE